MYHGLMTRFNNENPSELVYDSVNLVINEVTEVKESEKYPSISGNVSQKFKLQTYNRYSRPSIGGWSSAVCEGLIEFKLLSYKGNYCPSIGGWYPAECKGLTEFKLPSFKGNYRPSIGGWSPAECKGLKEFKLLSYKRNYRPSIGGWCPAEFKGLTEFKLPSYKENYRPSIGGWCPVQQPICVSPRSNNIYAISKAYEKYKSGRKNLPKPKQSTKTNQTSDLKTDKKNKDKFDELAKPCDTKIEVCPTWKSLFGPSFMTSLSAKVPIEYCHDDALQYRNISDFKTIREQLADHLFAEFNRKIFDNALDLYTPLRWSDKFISTAGTTTNCIRKYDNGRTRRSSIIKLSTKVVDTPIRLRDTLVHELCHAATWQVDGVLKGRHGPVWRKWADKAVLVFPELRKITRCHNLKIYYKYTFKCTACGNNIHRHSKSINITKTSCKYCGGKVQLIFNKKNKDGNVGPLPRGKPTAFDQYISDYYALYRVHGRTPTQVMNLLRKKFEKRNKNCPMYEDEGESWRKSLASWNNVL